MNAAAPETSPETIGGRRWRSRPHQTLFRGPDPTKDLAVDEHGAPVTFEPERWLVCFVPGLRPQFWHAFVHRNHKHVLMLQPNADGSWTLFEPWWRRLLIRTITTEQALRYLRWAVMGDALLVEEDVPGRGSQVRGWSNCASLAAFVLGRSYWVWSPHALFRRLLSEERTQHVDVAGVLDRCFAAEAGRHLGALREHLMPAGASCGS